LSLKTCNEKTQQQLQLGILINPARINEGDYSVFFLISA